MISSAVRIAWPQALSLAAALLLAGCDRFVSVETRLARAADSLEANEYQAALIDVRKALDADPDSLEAMLLHADVLTASGEFESARNQLDRAAAAGAETSKLEPRFLDLLIGSGDIEGAATVLATSNSLAPGLRATYEGRLQLLRQQPAEAVKSFGSALEAEPASIPATLGLAEATATQGRFAEALGILGALRQREPGSGEAWLLTGALEAQAGNFESAAQALTEAVTRGRGLSRFQLLRAHSALISVHLAAGQLTSAKEALAGLEAAAGEAPMVALMRARVALATGDVATAVNELRSYTRDLPREMTGRLLLSGALLESGNAEQAYAQAVRTVADFPDADEPQLALAEIQQRLGRTADAENTLTALATRPEPNPQALAMLGRLRIRQGESLAGIEYIRRSLAERPDDAQLQLQLAAAYLSAGDARRAAEVLDAMPKGEAGASRDRLQVIVTAALQGPEAAEREFQAAIARYPRDVDLLRLAAAHYGGAGDLDRARRYLQQALDARPDDGSLKLAIARLEVAGGRLDESEALVRRVLAQSPQDIAAMLLMADIENQRGRDGEVQGWLERARAAHPRAVEPRFALVRRAIAGGKLAEARELLDEVARVAADDAAVHLSIGELNSAAGRNVEAMVHLRRAAELDPSQPVIPFAKARVDLAEGRTAAARRSLRRAAEIAPDWLPALRTLVALEVREGNLDAALDVARGLRQRDPEGAASYLLEGDAYLGAGRPRESAPAFRMAYLRAPSAVLALRNAQAKSAARMARPTAELEDWLRRNAGDALARRFLAEYLHQEGRTREAIAELERVIEARPEDPVALNNLAWLYHEAGDARAAGVAGRAFELAPENGAVADTLGWILVGTGAAEKGLGILRKAAELSPRDGQVHYHLAFALNQVGQHEEAVKVLRALLDSGQQFPSRAEAERLLAGLLAG